MIINDKLREIYDKFANGLNRTEVSVMGMVATMAGYKTGDEWLSNVLEGIGDNYKYLKETLETELDYGEWFGAGYEGFIRMNLATDPVFVKQAAETIIREAKKYKK